MGDSVREGRPNHSAPLPSRLFTAGADTKRVATALVFLPLLYVLTRHLPPVAFFALVSATVLLAQREFVCLFTEQHNRLQPTVAGFLGSLFLLVAMQWPTVLSIPMALLCILIILLCYHIGVSLTRHRHLSVFIVLSGIFYLSCTLGHLLWLRNQRDGALLVFFVLLVTWAGDTAAYYAGTTWGSRPLAPQLSPNKTREGLLGGLIVAPVIAWIGQLWFFPAVTLLDCLILGLLLTVLGLAGDLSESAMKRQAGVKDSGSLIPGHGGMLDRVDSLIFNVPAFYYYMAWLKGP